MEPETLIFHFYKTGTLIFFDCHPCYQQQLIRLSDALEEKRHFTSSGRKIILLYDDTRPHTAKTTRDVISDLVGEILSHISYSPDLTPSDYLLFRFLQHHLGDSPYKSIEEIKRSIVDFIDSKQPFFF